MLQRLILLSVWLFLACNNHVPKKSDFIKEKENIVLEQIIQLDSIPLFHVSINNQQDTEYIPISNEYKTQLKCIGSDILKTLSKYIDTIPLLNYSTNLRDKNIDTSFKYFRNIKLYDPAKSKYFLAFSKPIFFNNKCYLEIDFNGISGIGYLYLLANINGIWRILLKKQTWVS